jgi:hypothetical protein
MTTGKWLTALSILTVVAGLNAAPPAVAVEGHDCSGTPPDAVMELPTPLSKWAQITCTPLGHMLTSREGWIWVMPADLETVLIPSQIVEKEPETVGNNSYFNKIDVTRVKGEEFNEAYKAFHVGFDDQEVKPDGYRVDLTTAAGKTLRMFFFDYDSYAWAMSCPENKCDSDTRFMILDKANRPKPRQPSI